MKNNTHEFVNIISIRKDGLIVEVNGGKTGVIPRSEMNRVDMRDEHVTVGDAIAVHRTGKQVKGKVLLGLVRSYTDADLRTPQTKEQSTRVVFPEGFFTPVVKNEDLAKRIGGQSCAEKKETTSLRRCTLPEQYAKYVMRDSLSWSRPAEYIGALVNATGQSWTDYIGLLFNEVKRQGLLSDTLSCINGMLREAGFSRRYFKPRPATTDDLIRCMETSYHNGEVALFSTDDVRWGCRIAAVVPTKDGSHYQLIDSQNRKWKTVKQVWVRRPKGKSRNSRQTADKKLAPAPEQIPDPYADYYGSMSPMLRYYQPNPLGIRTGDCVLRAFSAAFSVSWETAVDMISEANNRENPILNKISIYEEALLNAGYLKRKAPKVGNKPMIGVEFCEYLQREYPKGARILARLGKHHIAAILQQEDGSAYRVWDSWNSTACPVIDDYFVLPNAEDNNTGTTA